MKGNGLQAVSPYYMIEWMVVLSLSLWIPWSCDSLWNHMTSERLISIQDGYETPHRGCARAGFESMAYPPGLPGIGL